MSQVRSTEVVDAELAARDFVGRGYRRRRLGVPLEAGDVAADPAAGRVLWVPPAGTTEEPARRVRRRRLDERLDQAERRLRELTARLAAVARAVSAAVVAPPWRAVLLPHLSRLEDFDDVERALRLAEQLSPLLGWDLEDVREGIARELEHRAGHTSAESHAVKTFAMRARRPLRAPNEPHPPGYDGIDWMDDAEVDEC